MRIFYSAATFLAGSALGLLAAISVAHAQERNFDIPAEEATKAIPEFAVQAGLQIIAATEQLKGVMLPAVKGQQDARAALRALLDGSRLTILSDNGSVITIGQLQKAAAVIPAPVEALPLVVALDQPGKPRVSDSQSNQLEEITVTAQRRTERVEDVPAAITAFTAAQLEKQNVSSAEDLAKFTPGLMFNQSSFTPQPTIRGIGSRGLSAGEESDVPIYIDGVYQPNMISTNFQLNSVERIEILKGPQGALYGRNATGGAINVVTVAPPVDPVENASLSYGSYNKILAKAYIGGGTEELSADLAAVDTHEDGYFHDIASNSTRGGEDSYNVRGKVLFRPLENLRLTLVANHSQSIDNTSEMEVPINNNSAGFRFVPVPLAPTRPWDVDQGHDAPFKYVQSSISLTGVANFKWADVTFLTSDVHATQRLTNNNASGTSAPIYNGSLREPNNATYSEVYATSNEPGPFHWILGATYFTNDTKYAFLDIYSVNVSTLAGSNTSANNEVKERSLAEYLQLSYDLLDNLTATIGSRFTREIATFDVKNYISGSVTNPPKPINRSGSTTWSPFTPSANIEYRAAPRWNFYAKAGKGFKSGIYSGASSSLTPAAPEKITQYEIGAKTTFTRWLKTDLAVFHSDYTNMQVTSRDPVLLTPTLQNAASSKIDGVELEAIAKATSRLNLRLGLTYTNGHYSQFNAAQVTIPQTTQDPKVSTTCVYGTGILIGGNRSVFCNVSGNQLIQTPKETGNLGADYTWGIADGHLTLNGNLRYVSSFFWDALNRLREPAKTLLDGELSWRSPDDTLRVGLWGENLTDKAYNISALTSATTDLALRAEPRTVGVRISKDF